MRRGGSLIMDAADHKLPVGGIRGEQHVDAAFAWL